MPLSSKTVAISCPASTGSQAYTGVGFLPKAVVVLATTATSDDSSASGYRVSTGIATASGEQFSQSASADDAAATTNTRRGASDAVVHCVDANGTTVMKGSLTSLDADGFTINWTTVVSGARVKVLCLGGTDITGAKAIAVDSPNASTGAVAYTGVGFQPKTILHFGGWAGTTLPSQFQHAEPAFGAFVDGGAQWGISFIDEDAQATSDVDFIQDGGRIASRLWTTGVHFRGSVTAVGSDGFTINWTTAAGAPDKILFLCLAGSFAAKAGSFTRPSSVSTVGVTGIGLQPSAGFLASFNSAAADDTLQNASMQLSVGVADSAASELSIGVRSDDAAADSNADQIASSARILRWPANDGATLNSWDTDGFTLTWLAAAAGTEKVFYLVLGAVPPSFSSQPSASYGSGQTALTEANTPVTVDFTATDPVYTGSDELSYELRMSSTPGGGALVGSGTCTSGVPKSAPVTYAAAEAAGWTPGTSQGFYAHVSNGRATKTSNLVFVNFASRRRGRASLLGVGL